MVLMFSDHPDIFEFISTKNRQEDIAKVILREHNVHVELKQIAETKLVAGTRRKKPPRASFFPCPWLPGTALTRTWTPCCTGKRFPTRTRTIPSP